MTPPPLVVIVGCPRSGTTWLYRLLLAHPGTVGPAGESALFLALRPWFANASRADGAGVSAWLGDDTDATTVARQLTDALLAAFVESTGRAGAARPRLLIEKTPAHVHDLDVIAACYPDVHVIHLVRDGRDVARSLAEMEHGTGDVRTAAKVWVDALRDAARSGPRLGHFREVRYEDALVDPVAFGVDLLEWLGLDVDDTVRAAIARAGGERVSQFNTTGPVGSGKWRSLSAGDLAAVYDVAGAELIAHGYADAREVGRAKRRPAAVFARLRGR